MSLATQSPSGVPAVSILVLSRFTKVAGFSQPKVLDETCFSFTRSGTSLGPIIESLGVVVIAGTPFMEVNDIAVRPVKWQMIRLPGSGAPFTLEAQVVGSGEFVEAEILSDAPLDSEYAMEIRNDSSSVRQLTPSHL